MSEANQFTLLRKRRFAPFFLTQLLGAQAFTSKNDIFFNRNRFNPTTRKGEHLLAHELTHTIQQNGPATRPSGSASQPSVTRKPRK